MTVKTSENNVRGCMLSDVSCVPVLKCNLLSVARLSEVNKNVVLDAHGCNILNVDNRVLATGKKEGNFY